LFIPDPSQTEPCEASHPVTFCDLDVTNNVWVEGVVDLAAGKRGICMLDTLSRRQFISILQHDPRAREDLPRVTSNAELHQILADTKLLPQVELSDDLQSRANRDPAGIPFYSVFRGRPPTARPTRR
jgi:hypothetical protein